MDRQESLIGKAAFGQRLVGDEGGSRKNIWRKGIPGTGTATAGSKATRQDDAYCVRGTARRPVWLQQSEQAGEEDRGQKGGPRKPRSGPGIL